MTKKQLMLGYGKELRALNRLGKFYLEQAIPGFDRYTTAHTEYEKTAFLPEFPLMKMIAKRVKKIEDNAGWNGYPDTFGFLQKEFPVLAMYALYIIHLEEK